MYLLDANAFMEASRTFYGFDIAPGFWKWLEDPAIHPRVASVQAVRDEITDGTGELVNWANALPKAFWLADSSESVVAMKRAIAWATHSDRLYSQAAKDEFVDSADLRLIAHAMIHGATLVTREQSHPMSVNRIMIPDVCSALGVDCIGPFAAYRALGLRLVA